MALSFLIRHIKGLKMRFFSVSHALLNRHKRVSIVQGFVATLEVLGVKVKFRFSYMSFIKDCFLSVIEICPLSIKLCPGLSGVNPF